MADVVFIRDTVKRRKGDVVSFDEVSAAKIVSRGDAEYTGGSTERPPQTFPSLGGAWGVKADESAGE